MLQKLETPPAPGLTNSGAQAIVVLGGGTYFNVVEYGSDTVNRYSLERIRYAARLHQAYRQADTGDRRCSARQRLF